MKSRGVKRLVFLAHADGATLPAAQAITEGLILGDFEGDKYKTGDKKNSAPFESAALAGWDAMAGPGKAVEKGRIIAEAQNFARSLANEPANLLTPKILGNALPKWRESMVWNVTYSMRSVCRIEDGRAAVRLAGRSRAAAHDRDYV